MDAQLSGSELNELPDAMLLACDDNVVFRFFLLQHQPLRLDVISCVSPLASSIEITEIKAVLKAQFDASKGPCNFASNFESNKGFFSNW